MKKIKILFLAPLLFMTACTQNIGKYNNNLPSQKFSVSYNMDIDKNKAELSCDFKFENMEMIDKDFKKFSSKNVICGDELTVYYDDKNLDNIDHIVVEEVSILNSIEVTNTDVPGEMTRIELIADGWSFNIDNIEYVINKDYSITALRDIKYKSILYGVYDEYEIRDGWNFCRLLYVFSFNPRQSF